MKQHEPLTRQQILESARELADSEGLDAVTMRRLAAELGVEAMSLYHHIPNKEALLDGVVETIIGEVNAAISGSNGSNWRAAIRHRCLTARDVMVRHPWAPGLIATRRTVPASFIFYYEGILGLLIDGGLSYALAHKALHALGSMPLGFVQEIFSPAATGGNFDENATEKEFEKIAKELPHLTAMVASEIHANDGDMLGWCDSREEFEFTLDLLLDGLERKRRHEQ